MGQHKNATPTRGGTSSIVGTTSAYTFPGIVNAGDDVYDYAPSIMLDNGTYKMWWCSGVSGVMGDHVTYAEAASLDGPWTIAGTHVPLTGSALAPTLDFSNFDGGGICDPSVLKINGTYYMYYTALPTHGDIDGGPLSIGRIGVATSLDGKNFTRPATLNGQPIVNPARQTVLSRALHYGAGQPTTIYLDGFVYMMYTDTTGAAGGPNAGQYVIRSTDPLFQSNVQEFRRNGWTTLAPGQFPTGSHAAIKNVGNVDWKFIDELDMFAVAANWKVDPGPLAVGQTANPPGHTTVMFLDRDFNQVAELDVRGSFVEGAGLVGTVDGHTLSIAGNRVPLDIVSPSGVWGTPSTWDLSYRGYDLQLPPELIISPATLTEGNGSMLFNVQLEHASSEEVHVSFETRGLTAELGVDFEGTNCNLVFQSGELAKTCSVTIYDDFAVENDEQLELVATSSTNVVVNIDRAVGTILDNDVAVVDGDFDNDGDYDCTDIDALISEIASNGGNLSFDLNGDRMVSEEDRDAWLAEAGDFNLGSGNAYLLGDANLDGVVDVSDFNVWNMNKFTANPEWCAGDFSADGSIDVSDFNLWNMFKFQSSAEEAELLFLEFDGSLQGADGETPTQVANVTFETGVVGQSANTNANGYLKYPVEDNIEGQELTVEFWIRPNWNGNEGGAHTFFEVGNNFNNGIVMSIDGAENLRFLQWGDDLSTPEVEISVESGVGSSGSGWIAGEWYYMVGTWSGSTGDVKMYVNGDLLAANSNGVSIADFSTTELTIGSESELTFSADASFDLFTITSRIKSADEILGIYQESQPSSAARSIANNWTTPTGLGSFDSKNLIAGLMANRVQEIADDDKSFSLLENVPQYPGGDVRERVAISRKYYSPTDSSTIDPRLEDERHRDVLDDVWASEDWFFTRDW